MVKFKVDSKTEVIYKDNDWLVIENGTPQLAMPKYLYKYYSLNRYSLECIEKNYIHLSNPKDFNDPFDCNRNLIVENQRELSDWDYVEVLNDVSKVGIACFSDNGLEPLLWSHYTNSYSGFCIKFNLESLMKSFTESVKLKSVIYSDSPEFISKKHPFSSYYQYFLKISNWSYEREWRLLCQNPSDSDNKFYYDPSCIEEFSIGYKFRNDLKGDDQRLKDRFELIRKDKYNNVPLMSVSPHQTKLELKKIMIKEGSIEEALEMIKNKFPFLQG